MDAYVIAGARTPFCKAGTALARLKAQELGRLALVEAIARAEVEPGAIEAVVAGNVAGPPEATNVARVIAVEAGLDPSIPAHTVSRNCASGMEAVVEAARLCAGGEAGLVAAVGVESMSSVPVLFPDRFRAALLAASRSKGLLRLRHLGGLRPQDLKPIPGLLVGFRDPLCGLNMAETAELLAREAEVTRADQDRFALRSHQRAVAAWKDGGLGEETMPVFPDAGLTPAVASDNGPRADARLDRLERLRPVLRARGSTITAGNASMVSDGACAVLVASAERARALGLKPMARIRAHAVVGIEPRLMGLGPVLAMPLALARAGAGFRDVDLVEINEAFAAQVLACLKVLASPALARRLLGAAASGAAVELDPERLNVDGGAIALGHPVGASGARLVLTLARALIRRRLGLGVASLCVGGGQGQAVVLEAAA